MCPQRNAIHPYFINELFMLLFLLRLPVINLINYSAEKRTF